MTLFSRSVLLLIFAVAPLGGCGQGINDRCQIDADCGTGPNGVALTCVIPTGGSAAEGGTCQAATGTDASTVVSDLTATAMPDLLTPAGADLSMRPPDLLAAPPDLAILDGAAGN